MRMCRRKVAVFCRLKRQLIRNRIESEKELEQCRKLQLTALQTGSTRQFSFLNLTVSLLTHEFFGRCSTPSIILLH